MPRESDGEPGPVSAVARTSEAFSSLTGFRMPAIPVFVINLDRRADRLLEMQNRLSGIAFTRMSAVDGRELGPAEKRRAELAGLTPNEFACLSSHIAVLRKLDEDDLEHACVLEDDVFLGADFKSFMDDSGWIPPQAGLIKIETMRSKVWLGRAAAAARDRQLFRLRSSHFGTAGYVVSRGFAPRLVSILETLDGAADDVMFGDGATAAHAVMQLCPALCVQEFILSGTNAGSDIASGRKTLRAGLAPGKTWSAEVARKILRPVHQIGGVFRRLHQRRAIVPYR